MFVNTHLEPQQLGGGTIVRVGFRGPSDSSSDPKFPGAIDWGIGAILKIEVSFVSSIILLTVRFKKIKCSELNVQDYNTACSASMFAYPLDSYKAM